MYRIGVWDPDSGPGSGSGTTLGSHRQWRFVLRWVWVLGSGLGVLKFEGPGLGFEGPESGMTPGFGVWGLLFFFFVTLETRVDT